MHKHRSDTTAMTMAGLNLIQQALSIYDHDLRLVVANQRFEDMFALPPELVTPGASFGETIRFLATRGEYGAVDDVEQFVQDRIDLALAFEPHYLEREMANGRWISVEGSPIPEGGWVAVYTDITATKRAEQLLRTRSEELSEKLLTHAEDLSAANRKLASTVTALEEAKRQLTEAEARARLTAEMMPAHIAHVGLDRHYTYSNRRLSSVMPGSQPDPVGQHAAQVLGEQPWSVIGPELDKAYKGRASVFEFNHEPSSRRIRVALTPDDSTGGVYILSMDITEETQTRAALQQTRRREIAAQMISGLAHDFSNLLTIILGMQSRLQRMELRGDADELITATLSAAKRGGALLNRIADMTGAREVTPRATNIRAFLRDFETLASSALPPNVTLAIDNRIDTGALMLDSGMLQDSLLNLVLNARDACEGSGAISLTAHSVQNTWVEFSVCDTGPGFSPEALEHGFEPFFTTKGGEGSGLGLAMVYDMTKLAGGRASLTNCDSGGQVSLRLPLRPAPLPVEPGLVLLVEDSPDLRASIRDMLIGAGHTVIEAASVDEALALAQQIPDISLVLSDISLEGEASGVDLIDRLPDPHPPCFLMTSLPNSHDLFCAGQARAPILTKPFTGDELTAFLSTQPSPSSG
ncbi:PAS-domain containing protein [Alisedimentitalea sp. MJ-SS2]|uniref:hybrid sensor histidine kinase/response regulator n=1 Tax=Aliisedimentitalea sp. MJ-SS2 TaxID=3049795 RepID=UPI002912575A|nr:PAS-domain containing protein [Alisedimentitalea sp. MJ-SS2]MDU8927595.1 PAS-domain containing protein [Alisedimentitalea sp. MJ-SS2]